MRLALAKRLFDLSASLVGLGTTLPFTSAIAALVWLHDRESPFYAAPRVARGGGTFRLVKFRSMSVGADRSGVDSTAGDDPRITPIGRTIRRFKLDELPQLLNVLKGDMSLVGPRPNVLRDTALYTDEERRLLDVRPGITDLSSIVFADEGDILEGAEDPDLLYHQIIRPWKSRLGLVYVDNSDLVLDVRIILLTLLALVDRRRALQAVQEIIERLGADEELVRVAGRTEDLAPHPPPGASELVRSR